jgi:hypothetical protein
MVLQHPQVRRQEPPPNTKGTPAASLRIADFCPVLMEGTRFSLRGVKPRFPEDKWQPMQPASRMAPLGKPAPDCGSLYMQRFCIPCTFCSFPPCSEKLTAALPTDSGASPLSALRQSPSGKPAGKGAVNLGVVVASANGSGLIVQSTAPGGLAEMYGLERGDVITAVHGKPNPTSEDLKTASQGGFHPDSFSMQVTGGKSKLPYRFEILLPLAPPEVCPSLPRSPQRQHPSHATFSPFLSLALLDKSPISNNHPPTLLHAHSSPAISTSTSTSTSHRRIMSAAPSS